MVYILLGNGFEETEAIAPLDAMRRADIQVKTLGIGGTLITGSHGLVVTADACVDKLSQEQMDGCDLVMLPGGLGGVASIQGSKIAMELIQNCYDRGAWVAAICAAPTILGKLGLLSGKQATVYPGMEDGLVDGIPQNSNVVIDGNIITGEAAGSAWAFGLTLVSCLKDRETAEKVANAIHYHGTF